IVTLVNTPAAIALGLIHAIDSGDPVEMAWSVLAIVAHAPTRQTQVFGQGIAVRASPRVLAPTARGVATETRVLQDLGLVKHTQLVKTAEGASIPDALTPSLSVEIKDSAYVSATRQVRIQTGAAAASGRLSTLVTGTNTRISGPARDLFDQI